VARELEGRRWRKIICIAYWDSLRGQWTGWVVGSNCVWDLHDMTGNRRVCLFTGISGTLGSAFARLHADDYTLVGVYHTVEPSVPFLPLGDNAGLPSGGIFAVESDLSVEGAADALVEMVMSQFGSVDLLVNAASYRRFAPFNNRDFVASLARQFLINVCVPAQLVAALSRFWQPTPSENRDRRRSVINLSSNAGHDVYPGYGQSGFGATKAALNMLTCHQAEELASFGVRANAVAPTTFPGQVPTEAVVTGVREYDCNNRSGDILVIDTDGRYLLGEESLDVDSATVEPL
jgi:NAD(P)-dependent dehydrogenase (short-subunit alcohol dehydrogenase family)